MKKQIKSLFLCTTLLLSSGCQPSSSPQHTSTVIFALDTVITTDLYGKEVQTVAELLEKNVHNMEEDLSRTLPDSRVYALNHGQSQKDPEILSLVQQAEKYSQMTSGAFDITIAPVADLWGFTKEEFRIPEDQEISQALSHVGMDHIHLDSDTVTLDPGTEIDLGGIAKGLAVEQAYALFSDHGITNGIANFGGDAAVYGSKPDGKPWRIGIQNPDDPSDTSHSAAIVSLKDAYILTSGNYQRYFIEDGIRYHHIIDPFTGAPARNDLMSVTIIADAAEGNGILCDALSTGLFVMGKEKAVSLWQNNRDAFQMILITSDHQLFYTEGLKDCILFPEQSGYENRMIR